MVDDLVYDIIAIYEDCGQDEIVERLSGRYERDQILEALGEVRQLEEDGLLFTEDTYKDYIIDFKSRPTVVKALCLHIAHDCNWPANTVLQRRVSTMAAGLS